MTPDQLERVAILSAAGQLDGQVTYVTDAAPADDPAAELRALLDRMAVDEALEGNG